MILLLSLAACHSTTESGPTEQALHFDSGTLPTSRPGEQYALWIEFPANTTQGKHSPQHGLFNTQLVSTFRIDASHAMIGFDTSGFAKRIGISYARFVHAEVSLERIGGVRDKPTNVVLYGEIPGSGQSAAANFSPTHFYAFGDSVRQLAGSATLGSPSSAPSGDWKGEVYLMSAHSSQSAAPGLTNFYPLPSPWRHAAWVVDSSQTPPTPIFLGFIDSPSQASKDGAALSRFPYPGGRLPADTTRPPLDLTDGHHWIVVNAEPTLGDSLPPQTPFGAVLLSAQIPSNAQPFTPWSLVNVTSSLPNASLVVSR